MATFATMWTRYRVSHRRATRAQHDAYGMALHHLATGRMPSYRTVNPLINGGACLPSAIRAGIRDAIRDYQERTN